MEALVLHGFQDYRHEKVPIPIPGPKELLIKVEAVGICASDGKVYSGSEKYWGKSGEGNKMELKLPLIPGHEFSGRVFSSGPGGLEHHCVEIGDLVVAEQILTCNNCRFCQNSQYQVCVNGVVFGFNKIHNGAMSEYMIFPSNSRVHKIPKGAKIEISKQ